eukprot:GHVU01222659.1.p1 GENE.GHVU01222659.1~~GHVU01222659.1.p1  ORF type:complete len:299 (-),score=6.12 GHVU01222659.1:187-1083(-)
MYICAARYASTESYLQQADRDTHTHMEHSQESVLDVAECICPSAVGSATDSAAFAAGCRLTAPWPTNFAVPLFANSLAHAFTISLPPPLTRSFHPSRLHAYTPPCSHASMPSRLHTLTPSFPHPFTYSFIHWLTYLGGVGVPDSLSLRGRRCRVFMPIPPPCMRVVGSTRTAVHFDGKGEGGDVRREGGIKATTCTGTTCVLLPTHTHSSAAAPPVRVNVVRESHRGLTGHIPPTRGWGCGCASVRLVVVSVWVAVCRFGDSGTARYQERRGTRWCSVRQTDLETPRPLCWWCSHCPE